MEQLVLLIIIGLISFVNWIIQKSAERRNRQQGGELPDPEPDFDWETPDQFPKQEPVNRRAPLSEDERARQFMEALGLPAGTQSPAPPPLPQQTTQAPVSQKKAALPVHRDSQPRLATPMPDAPWQRRVHAPELSKAETEALARVESQAGSGAYNIRSRADRDLASSAGNVKVMSFLRSREGLKAAVIAREILGTPPGMQPLPGPEVVRL